MSETDDLLAQAQAIQAQKVNTPEVQLLAQAKKIQQQKLPKPEEQFSPMESRAIGALHGVTGGLSGAIAGAGNALGDVLGGGATQESADQSIGLRPDLAAKPSKVADYHPSYSEGMADQLATEKAAHDQNPFAYNSAEFAGSILPVMAGGSALKAAGMASPVAQGAALGAGLGETNYLGSNADPTALGAVGSATLGAGLGAAGGKLGSLITPTAQGLETQGSKLAQEAMGMNSAKDLTSQFNPMTGQVERGSDIIKGTGTTALNEGVLKGGQGKWYDNAIAALQNSYKKLPPLFSQAQSKIDQDPSAIIDEVGSITTKTPDIMQRIFDGVPQSSQKNVILRKIQQQYGEYAQKLEAADGNLQQLNQIKQELTTAAQNLKPQIYNNGSASAEADLYKQLGGVVRQHIEDLSNAAQDGLGDQIHQVNKTIGNLSSTIPSLQKLTRGGVPMDKADLAVKVLGPVEGFIAKGLNAASNVDTPIGTLVQKTIPAAPTAITTNPWSQENAQKEAKKTVGPLNPQSSSATASGLYNATDDSLRMVADKLGKQAGMGYTADYLKKALDDNDMNAKNRAIFLIMQSPSARKLVTPGE